MDWGEGTVWSEGQGRIKNDFQVLSFSMWSLVVVFIEIGKRREHRCQRTIRCSVLNVENVKAENAVRHLVQVSEGDFGCADLELRGEIWAQNRNGGVINCFKSHRRGNRGPLPSSLSTAEEVD